MIKGEAQASPFVIIATNQAAVYVFCKKCMYFHQILWYPE
jgi:hypothetical protein